MNNLAVTSWYHSRELERTKTIPEETKEKEQAKKDSEHILGYFKETIEKLEKLHTDKHDLKRTLNEL